MNRVDRWYDGPSTLALRRQGIVRALEAMRLQLADRMSLAYLAKIAAMSRFHFERVFHQVTGLAPFQFLSAIRLVRARDLVLNTNASIATICFDVGYSSIGTFTRRFTASVGVSPRRLRRLFDDRHEPTLCTRPAVSPAPGCGVDVVVHCHGVTGDAQIFIGAFPSPVPIGRPKACGTAVGTSTVVLRDVPLGSHYVLGAARPAHAANGRLAGGETFIGMAYAALGQGAGQLPQEVTVQFRPIEVTDPPIVSCLPLLFHERHARSLQDAILPNDSRRHGVLDGSRQTPST